MTDDRRHPTAEPEVHLLPDGFIGHVTIKHGKPEGAAAERDGAARLYRIPTDGVLVTQAKPNYGIRPPERMKFFWVDAAGSRTSIPAEDEPGDGPRILACYSVATEFHYFVDRRENAGRYKNPALSDAEDRG